MSLVEFTKEHLGDLPIDNEGHPKYETREYIDLHTIYPDEEIESDTYRIKQIVLTKQQVQHEKLRGLFSRKGWMYIGLQADFSYISLIKKGEGCMMSDTPMERNTNRDFVKKANGDVLIFGLGLGLVILPLLEATDVRSVTVVELHQDLIDVVEPILKKHDKDSKLKVIQGDCFEYHKSIPKDKKWDCIYGDIWISISADNYEEMKDLTKKYKFRVNRKNKKSFIDHWMKQYCKREYLSYYDTEYDSDIFEH